MAIASLKPTVDVPIIQQKSPDIHSENYISTVVDAQNTALSSLLQYVSGMPWSVTYYSQIITSQSDLKEQDIGELPVYQQYEKINRLEIRVTDAITGQQNTNTAQMTITGTALLYPFMTPQVGDTFIADAGLGQLGVYNIDSTERKSFNLETVYSVAYHLMTFVDSTSTRLLDLNNKVIREYYFDKSRIAAGESPKLATTAFNNLQSLNGIYSVMVSYYFDTFYNHNYGTLVVPGQNTGIYDAFLVDYILKIVDTFDCMKVRQVRNYSTDSEDYINQPQLWKMLLDRDITMLPYLNRYMGLVMTKFFNYNSMFKGIRYSRLSYLVYPVTADFSLLDPNSLVNNNDPILMDYGVPELNTYAVSPLFKPQSFQQIVEAKSSGGSLSNLLQNTYANTNSATNIINQIVQPDMSYLLSPAFYTQTGTLSLIEALITNYLKKIVISIPDLLTCCGSYKKWGRLEQFYYIPILLTLIKTAKNEAYS